MPEIRFDLSVPDLLPESLPVLALRKGVLLPGGLMPLTVGRAPSLAALKQARGGLILVAAQREAAASPGPSDLLPSAVLARIIDDKPLKGHVRQVLVQGLARVSFTGFPATRPSLEATFARVNDAWPDSPEAEGLRRELVRVVTATADELGGKSQVQPFLEAFGEQPGVLADAAAFFIPADDDWKREVLATHDPLVRTDKVLKALVRIKETAAAQQAVRDRVNTETRDMQRDFYLRRQLDAIRKELGETDGDDELSRIREKLDAADLPDEVLEVVSRELSRLERLNGQSPERSVAVDWLQWVADMPWNAHTAVDPDLRALESALERTHYGLQDVKRQVLEHLAVRKFAGHGRGEVLLLVGPPGVGKTSIGQAIADATGRKLLRVALGGLRDEAELRGHRRTYIGARPGRLIEGIRRGGTSDPVVLLDEIDKLGRGMSGDPGSALLEILDPEQNHHFVDRYLEVPVDLSKALFIATANDLSQIPGPLRDRMTILTLEGYTAREKQVIAREHLLPVVATNAGLQEDDVAWTDEALKGAIAGWTREAGVRELQRVLGKGYRHAAVKKALGELDGPLGIDVPDLERVLGRRRFYDDEQAEAVSRAGIATGLAWTPVGGSTLYVEASTLPGRGNLVLTGQLGDVMKESARAALTYVLANAERLGIDAERLQTQDVHIHVPAGGTPKDGPSAGVTMFTALTSLLTDRPVRADTAMTGEATLRGRVLPVGGITSKVLAAHRRGITRVILPKRNARDLDDLPDDIRDSMTFFPVEHMDEALAIALTDEPASTSSAEEAAA